MQHAAADRPNPVTVGVADDHLLYVAGIVRLAARCAVRVHGVSMGDDGVPKVISRHLPRADEAANAPAA